MADMVNHPAHYKSDTGLEVIDVIEAFFPGDAHLSHVFKYMARNEKKDTPESNIRKAIWWLIRKLQFITGTAFLPVTEYFQMNCFIENESLREYRNKEKRIRLQQTNKGTIAAYIQVERAPDIGGMDFTIEEAEVFGRMLLSAVEDTK